MVTQKNYVMLNNHDLISLVENYLEKINVEYQCLYNRIEIYHLDRGLIVVEINQNSFSILYNKNNHEFEKIDEFFKKLDELLI